MFCDDSQMCLEERLSQPNNCNKFIEQRNLNNCQYSEIQDFRYVDCISVGIQSLRKKRKILLIFFEKSIVTQN